MLYYSVREFSEMFDVKVRTVRNWIFKKKLKAKKDKKSKRWKISEKTVEDFAYDNKN